MRRRPRVSDRGALRRLAERGQQRVQAAQGPVRPRLDPGRRRRQARLAITGSVAMIMIVILVPLAAASRLPVNVVIGLGVILLLVLFGVTLAALAIRRGAPAVVRVPGAADPSAGDISSPPPHRTWTDARERFHRLRADYAAFECDAMQVLRLPALVDVSVPSTARFVDAFAEAQALETDGFPGPDHATRFGTAVDGAERTWQAANDAAHRIRLSRLSPDERSAVERVIKLLTTARDSGNEPERLSAYAKARSELARLDRAGVVHVPLPASAALDDAARGQLPG